ncbi:MAG: hypothetical protein M3430_08405 [Acidobacteriota bacterium]|jgi:hypothetical protein|nr:hypothetical protein [Acidobacteriota bacterium]
MGFLDEVSKVTVGKLFNWSGERKDMLCARCRKVTRHVSVSHAETLAKSRNWVTRGVIRVCGKVMGDLNPVANLFEGRPYRCAKCNVIRYD